MSKPGQAAKLSQKQKGKQREEPSAAAAPAQAGPSKPPKSSKPEKSKTRRLHVAGLPSISEQEVRDRFKSFGTVTAVDGLGKLDANGQPLRYAFIDINITKSKLQQCMNLLSGSMWKGSVLRISRSKPSSLDKLDRERRELARQVVLQSKDPSVKKASKKRKRGEAIEGEDQTLVASENVKTRKGWKLDPSTSTPIFPLVARPSHPLPPVPTSAVPVKKAEKAAKRGKEDQKPKNPVKPKDKPSDPPNRARRVKIDPTKWQPSHLREGELQKVVENAAIPRNNTQAVPPAQESVEHASGSSESETSLENQEGDDEEAETEEEETDEDAASQDDVDDTEPESSHAYDETAAKAERERSLALARQLVGANSDALPVPHASEANVQKQSSDEESDEQEGASTAASDHEAKESEQEHGHDEEGETSTTEAEDMAGVEASPAEQNGPALSMTNIQMNSLTEMFKPQEATIGFSLGNLLDDVELDELEEEEIARPAPTAASATQAQERFVAPQKASRPAQSYASDFSDTFFFPFPLAGDFEPGGLFFGMTEEQKQQALSRSWTGLSKARRFKRTQTLEEIAALHESIRPKLSEDVRKRHREAVKRRKRFGGSKVRED